METDPTRICELLVGLPEVVVRGVQSHGDAGPLVVHGACPEHWQQDCPTCGVRGWVQTIQRSRLTERHWVRQARCYRV